MRILFITNEFPNRIEPTKAVFNRELARALARSNDVCVISPISWVDELRARVQRRGGSDLAPLNRLQTFYPRYYYPPRILRRWYGWFFWLSIRRTALRQLTTAPPDAVLSYWAHPDGEAALRAARRAGVPAVTMVGGSDLLLLTRDRARRRRVQRVLCSADAVVAVSHGLRQRAIELGTPPEKAHVIDRGVDCSLFHPGDPTTARNRLGINRPGKMILWVGRLVPVKGLDILLAACARLQAANIEFHLYIIGDGPLHHSLRKQATDRQLDTVVTFVGAQPHASLPDWYRAADLVVLPSRSEGSPNVLREARACGVSFVASRVGGIPEICGPADRLVAPDDPAALAQAIAAALAQGRPQFDQGRQHMTWDESAAALVRLINSLPVKPHYLSDGIGRSSLARQIIRRAMSTILPRRMFLTGGPAGDRTAAITFDDGPHPEHTPRVLDVLARRGVKATFFLIGRLAQRCPELVGRIAEEGHTIGNHSFEHSDPKHTTARELLDEVRRTDELLAGLVGPRARLFRPPKGKLTLVKLWGLWRAGQTVVLWNRDPRDYACRSVDDLQQWVQRNPARGGDLFLFHDAFPHAASVLDKMIDQANDAGLRLVTLSQWVGRD